MWEFPSEQTDQLMERYLHHRQNTPAKVLFQFLETGKQRVRLHRSPRVWGGPSVFVLPLPRISPALCDSCCWLAAPCTGGTADTPQGVALPWFHLQPLSYTVNLPVAHTAPHSAIHTWRRWGSHKTSCFLALLGSGSTKALFGVGLWDISHALGNPPRLICLIY